jgi:hypothetical protein
MLSEPQAEIADLLASYAYDPYGYTLACFPWGEGELETSTGPRAWQKDVLTTIRDHLKNPKTRFVPLRIAIASGHGIGKSALVAFIDKWAMGTCEDAKRVITANTFVQLNTKTQPELRKWFRLAIDADIWQVKSTSICPKDPSREKTWRSDLIPWDATNPEAFSGLHNQKKLILLVFDEASGIDDVIWDTAQGALTDENTIIIWLAFGNPTLPTGRFAECFGSKSSYWIHKQIDARTVEGTNKEEISRWERERGADSDFFRVRVRGEFPIQGNAQFISSASVERARRAEYAIEPHLPKIISVDPARFGEDESVIGLRQGRVFRILEAFHEKPTDFTGERVIHWIQREKPGAVVIDETGLGAGVIDYVRHRGFNANNGHQVVGFNGGATPIDQKAYYNKRAECWGKAKEWLEAGASIPDDPEMAMDLCGITFDYSRVKGQRHGSIILESKDEMKRRGLRSPDRGDVLSMSFAVNLAAKTMPRAESEWRPGSWVPPSEGSWMA